MNRLHLTSVILSFITSLTIYGQSKINDPLFDRQWGLQNTGQEISRTDGDLTRIRVKGIEKEDINWINHVGLSNKEIIVAVIDSGVDIGHPDLAGKIWFNKSKCQNLSIQEQEKEDCYGWNFLDGNSNLEDEVGHGTHVAGIIAAKKNNGMGITGLAPENVKIMPLKIMNKSIKGFVYNKKVVTNIIADAIAYAISHGANVINLSLGWPKLINTKKVRYGIKKALEKNIAVVVAAGNNGKTSAVFPCSTKGVICVAASDNQGKLTEFSNYGGKVELAAPGEYIISTYPRNLESRLLRIHGYEAKKGSSYAAPFVSGIVASLMSYHPNLTLDEIKTRLFMTARPIKGRKSVKYGVVDYKAAFELKTKNIIPEFDLKSISSVIIDSHNSFKVPVEINWSGDYQGELPIAVSLVQGENIFNSKQLKINSQTDKISISATIDDLNIDSNINLNIKFRIKDKEFLLKREIVITREIKSLGRVTKVDATDLKSSTVASFKYGRKYSKMKAVADKAALSAHQELFYIDSKLQSADSTIISLVKTNLSGTHYGKIVLPKVNQVLHISIIDLNLDGERDYFIYSMGKDQENLILSYIGSDYAPLYGNSSHMSFPISHSFKGLPYLKNIEQFGWLRLNHKKLGPILTPLIEKEWEIPQEDNTLDPLDQLDNILKKRPYYLNPVTEGDSTLIKIRTLESFNFLQTIREHFDLYYDEMISISILNQPATTLTSGKINALLTIGQEFNQLKFIIEFNSPLDFKLRQISVPNTYLNSNKHILVEDLRADKNSNPKYASFSLIRRNQGRMAIWDDELKSTQILESGSWGDVLADVANVYQTGEGQYLSLLETRYYIYADLFNNAGDLHISSKISLERESSFPGVNFSETMIPTSASASISGQAQAALFVDSTTIFSNRLYFMVWNGAEFIRPVSLSFLDSPDCVKIGIHKFLGKNYLNMMCKNKEKKLEFLFIKL